MLVLHRRIIISHKPSLYSMMLLFSTHLLQDFSDTQPSCQRYCSSCAFINCVIQRHELLELDSILKTAVLDYKEARIKDMSLIYIISLTFISHSSFAINFIYWFAFLSGEKYIPTPVFSRVSD